MCTTLECIETAAGIAVACGCLIVGSAPLTAQASAPGRWTVTLAAGPSFYDFTGSSDISELKGAGVLVAAHVDYALGRNGIAEISLNYFEYSDRNGTHRSLLPEANVQYVAGSGTLRPHVGIGGGLFEGKTATVHGLLGTRVALAPRWTARVEGRGRIQVPFNGWADLTFGVGRAF